MCRNTPENPVKWNKDLEILCISTRQWLMNEEAENRKRRDRVRAQEPDAVVRIDRSQHCRVVGNGHDAENRVVPFGRIA